MRRRDFIAVLGGVATVPAISSFRAHAQQVPVVGYLISRSADDAAHLADAFRQGLRDSGFVDGQNVKIEYRWGDGRFERLPGLAKELVDMRVSVLAATGGEPAVMAAHAATSTIPIVFAMSADPIKMGLAVSINRPGGNATGVNVLNVSLEAKRFGLLREMAPQAMEVGALLHTGFPQADEQLKDLQQAATQTGVALRVLRIAAHRDIDTAFETIVRDRIGALVMAGSPYFDTQRARIITLAEHYRVPTIYNWREYPISGGLMSYGIDLRETHRQVGRYAGQILKGEKAGDLPIIVPSKFEFVINLKTAKAIGLTIPPTLLARADEVIE